MKIKLNLIKLVPVLIIAFASLFITTLSFAQSEEELAKAA